MTLDDKLKKVIADGEALAKLADRAAPIAKDLRLDDRHKTVVDLAARARDKNFQIIFAGEFNSGKSTTINALLGQPAMPMKPVEANAILTKIYYGPTKRALLYLANGGSPQQVPNGDFGQHIVVDRKDRKKASQWAYAELFYPLEILNQGVVIVDPPGTNALPERQDMTMDEARKSDAAVFMFFATQPFKESERNFIVGCLDGKETFWIVTHADGLDADERGVVREDIADRLREIRPHDPFITSRMFFVDARRAQEAAARGDTAGFAASGMQAFFQALGDFIAGDRHRAKMQDLCAVLAKSLQALDQAAESQHRDTERDASDVARRRARLKIDVTAAAQTADTALLRLTSSILPQAATVRRMVRSEIRGLPADPRFATWDLKLTELPTSRMDYGFDKDKRERIVEEIRTHVVSRVQGYLQNWFRVHAGLEVRRVLKAELDAFDRARQDFEARLATIRDEYLGLPPSAPGHQAVMPDLDGDSFTDVIASVVRSVNGTAQVPARMISRTFSIWANTPYGDDGAGTWTKAKSEASQTFVAAVARLVINQIADSADDLAETAHEEMLAWFTTVEAAAATAISDPRIDLEKTALEGERTSQLQAQEKQARRDQLAVHRANVLALIQELAVLQARHGMP